MDYKTILRNNYFDIDFYYQGVLFGIMYSKNDQRLMIGLPFFIIDIKTYMFGRNKRLKMGNKKAK